MTSFQRTLGWVREHMPVTAAAVAALPSLKGVRLACSMHLEVKMVPALAGLLERGAELFLTTCNPHTVDDETVAWAEEQGARARAFRGIPDDAQREAVEQALNRTDIQVMAMGTLASGYLKPAEAFPYVFSRPAVQSVVVGVSTQSHAAETFAAARGAVPAAR